jgi:hypothetical protein
MKNISMDEDEIETVWEWSREKKTENGYRKNLFEVQQFLGIWQNYRRMILKYSEKAERLTMLTKKMTHLYGRWNNISPSRLL